jgi:hypothetical protein
MLCGFLCQKSLCTLSLPFTKTWGAEHGVYVPLLAVPRILDEIDGYWRQVQKQHAFWLTFAMTLNCIPEKYH